MKTRHSSSTAGVALVIVLSFLVLISAITLGFFSSVSTELASSKAVSNSALTRQLADSAVNVVMSQFVDATKAQAGGDAVAWTSQPGMIRTFETSGAPRDFFKLYSSDAMTVGGAGFNAAAEVPPADWNSPNNSELYTDLNAPIANTNGELVYPIVDPSADGSASPGRPNDGFKVSGFSISSSPGFAAGQDESAVNNRAPMPVKWIYVLKDGALKAGTVSGNKVNVSGATATNPIVGRISFWADDETAKVNINTASEGTYWDVPRTFSMEDFGQGVNYGLALAQPVQKEYQRYPGHPATTSLSAVFGSLLPVSAPYPANPKAADSAKLDPYYNLIPRIGAANSGGGGGSKGGSFQVASGTAVFTPDAERLYASVDELMFSPKLTGGARIPNTSNDKSPKTITKGVIEKAGFFITANSNAPETTLFNTPRVAVWPVMSTTSTNKGTAYDSLLAFCSTIGGKEYYFTRNPLTGARRPDLDFPIGGRNVRLYEYLQKLTSTDIPGFGGNFLGKYGPGPLGATDRDQILTSICDYIRCTNLQDQSTGAKPYTPLFSNGQPLGAGEVVPLRIGTTQGYGRFYSVTSANLLFYGTAQSAGKTTKMRAVFFLGFTTPMQGLACMRSGLKYKVMRGLDGLQVKGSDGKDKDLKFRAGGTNYMDTSDLSLFHGRSVGGTESPWQAIQGKPFANSDAGGDAPNKYPFFSFEDVDVTGLTELALTAKQNIPEIVVEVRTRDGDQLIQTLNFAFPPGNFKVPGVAGGVATATFGSRTGGQYDRLVDSSDTVVSLQVAGGFGNDPRNEVDGTAGDVRMTACLFTAPSGRFRADKEYKNSKVQFAHCLVQSVGEPFNGAKYGKLAPVTTYVQTNSIARQPDVPSRALTGVTRMDGSAGDWDTGFGDQKDGAYINKPDEGDTALQDNAGGATRLPYMLGYGQGFASATNTYFSPNRLIPSPLMFGSIPTGVQRLQPWQTLLFHPRPEDAFHPGKSGGSPKDHLIADLFWMPVVEPYAISQPFATAGKINLNYQIMPFTYINRSTGLHAAMKSTKFAAIPVVDSSVYKPLDKSGATPTAPNRRRTIDMPKTLADFDTKFKDSDNKKNIFKSASEICEMNLVPPEVGSSAGMGAFWTNNKLTGDNLREKPYADLYSRLTTKSNTYTVHVRVQALKKAPGSPAGEWVAAKDKVVGEYRGASIIERYIDLNDPNLPDFAAKFVSDPNDASLNIDQYYKMRVVSTKRFAP